MAAGLPLTKSVLTPLTNSVLMSLGLTAEKPVTDVAIQKKLWSRYNSINNFK